ncbi:MAG: hypothetical protein DRO99_03700 [Candidatus Aenigmatarchaeota archaeon]|nr:MAG: hypothetical protein DRO99_03700 [Candidatus Aenigmarchaeota archaeon]
MKKRKTEIKFNSKLYCKECIADAVKAFSDTCECSVKDEGNYSVVSINTDMDANHVRNEFCNYVLGLMKNSAKV